MVFDQDIVDLLDKTDEYIINLSISRNNLKDIHDKNELILRGFCAVGLYGLVRTCVEKYGCDIHADNDQCLLNAAQFGHLNIVKFLVKKGANIHADDEHAIYEASKKGHLDIIKYLVKKGADVNARDGNVLMFASINGNLELVKFLIENGADMNMNDLQSVYSAIDCNHIDILKYFIENTDIEQHEYDYFLEYAIIKRKSDIIRYFIDKDVFFDELLDIIVEHIDDNDIFEYIYDKYSNSENSKSILVSLFRHGKLNFINHVIRSNNLKNRMLKQPLLSNIIEVAARYNNVNMIEYLVEWGVNISENCGSALKMAAYMGNYDTVKYLIELGVNIHANDDVAFFEAIRKGSLNIVKLLIKKGVDIHVRDGSALAIAMCRNHIHIVKYLIKKGMTVNVSGREAIDIAVEMNNLEMIKFLIENGADPQYLPPSIKMTLGYKLEWDKKPDNIPEFKKDEECPISQVEFTDDIPKLGCSECLHLFEQSALEDWFKLGNEICPMCRTGKTFYLA